jgi:uncharacterized protein (DUF1800 family)
MTRFAPLPALLVLAGPLLCGASMPQESALQGQASTQAESEALPWNRRTVEHLLNRAGFGATQRQVAVALRKGPERVVEELVSGGEEVEPPAFRPFLTAEMAERMKTGDEAERRALRNRIRRADRGQLARYTGWWIERMVGAEDPLRDRMTLFWHGFFTTSSKDVKRSVELINQHRLLRENAIESYATLLSGIVLDPAMLDYLDNSKNKKGKPNENLARELMELFSLGEGHYSEDDIAAVARALTGYQATRTGEFRFNEHDRGRKAILGQTGRFAAEDVTRILLEQEACALWISGRIIEYLEGVWPEAERHQEYAACLREADYELRPFLRKLLLDPRFYREEVLGNRIMGPVDYLVSSQRRLGIEVSPLFVYRAAQDLGQTLFQPPNVKGWEGGEAWITTASLLGRGNAAGLMLGVLDLGPQSTMEMVAEADDAMSSELEMEYEQAMSESELDEEDMMMSDGLSEDADGLPTGLKRLRSALGAGYTPELNLTWRLNRRRLATEEEIVDAMLSELLAIEAPSDTRAALLRHLTAERSALGLRKGELLQHPQKSEPVLRRLAHLILSLPEAQLN